MFANIPLANGNKLNCFISARQILSLCSCVVLFLLRVDKSSSPQKEDGCFTTLLTLTLTLNKIYFDINEKDKQQEIDNMISRYQ